VVASPAPVRLARRQDAQLYTLATPRITVKIDKRNGAVSFFDAARKVLLREGADGRAIAPATQAGVSGSFTAQSFELPHDEGIYGLGQHQSVAWNYRSSGAQGAVVTVTL